MGGISGSELELELKKFLLTSLPNLQAMTIRPNPMSGEGKLLREVLQFRRALAQAKLENLRKCRAGEDNSKVLIKGAETQEDRTIKPKDLSTLSLDWLIGSFMAYEAEIEHSYEKESKKEKIFALKASSSRSTEDDRRG
ncbi:hypothetical protein NL676_025750 [Syzygium grande]|nr:hypothetical protein NL676_025750 [Syzygium grande]